MKEHNCCLTQIQKREVILTCCNFGAAGNVVAYPMSFQNYDFKFKFRMVAGLLLEFSYITSFYVISVAVDNIIQ